MRSEYDRLVRALVATAAGAFAACGTLTPAADDDVATPDGGSEAGPSLPFSCATEHVILCDDFAAGVQSSKWSEVVPVNGGALSFAGGVMSATSPAKIATQPVNAYLRKELDTKARSFRIEASVAIAVAGKGPVELMALYMDPGGGDRWTASVDMLPDGTLGFTQASHIGNNNQSNSAPTKGTLRASARRLVVNVDVAAASPSFAIAVDGAVVFQTSIAPTLGIPNAIVGIDFTNAESWDLRFDDVIIDAR